MSDNRDMFEYIDDMLMAGLARARARKVVAPITWEPTPPVRAVVWRDNNAVTNDPCALCGQRCDPNGWDPFVPDSWALVCERCAGTAPPRMAPADDESSPPVLVRAWGIADTPGDGGDE
jgi:hypothetical protein